MNQVAHQVHRTITSPRRFGFVSLAVLVGVALYFVAALPVVRNAASAVQYQSTSAEWVVIEPLDSVLCPGETMSYTVTISVDAAPAFVDIYEAWCVANAQCPREFKLPADFSIAGQEMRLNNIPATRVVPDLPAGEWEFRHISVTRVNADSPTVSGYSLHVTVPDNCAK